MNICQAELPNETVSSIRSYITLKCPQHWTQCEHIYSRHLLIHSFKVNALVLHPERPTSRNSSQKVKIPTEWMYIHILLYTKNKVLKDKQNRSCSHNWKSKKVLSFLRHRPQNGISDGWSSPQDSRDSSWLSRLLVNCEAVCRAAEGMRCLHIKGGTNESAERRVLPGSDLLLAMIVEVITNT